jgi:hypothetical protein
VDHEVHGSRKVLESQLGGAVRSIAYPHGLSTARTLDAVESAGYRLGCTVDHPPRDPRRWLALPRTMMLESDRGPRMLLKLSGWYGRLRGKLCAAASLPTGCDGGRSALDGSHSRCV